MNNLEIKNELENKNALSLDTEDTKAISARLKVIDKIGDVIKEALVEGINNDYSVIPTCKKPSLLAPGAHKITQLFGLQTDYEFMNITNNIVLVKCKLMLGDRLVSSSFGSDCVLPKLKKDGTPDTHDTGWQTNRAFKMAQKRALVGAVMNIANLSKVFTQDMEDPEGQPQLNQPKPQVEFSNNIAKEKIFAYYAYIAATKFAGNHTYKVRDAIKIEVAKHLNAYNIDTAKQRANMFQLTDAEYDDFLNKRGLKLETHINNVTKKPTYTVVKIVNDDNVFQFETDDVDEGADNFEF